MALGILGMWLCDVHLSDVSKKKYTVKINHCSSSKSV